MNASAADVGGGALARLDSELTRRGLARSRTAAARLIESGAVLVNGVPSTKTGLRVASTDELAVAGETTSSLAQRTSSSLASTRFRA